MWPHERVRKRAHLAAYWTIMRRCVQCARYFAPLRHDDARYCSAACRMRAYRARMSQEATNAAGAQA